MHYLKVSLPPEAQANIKAGRAHVALVVTHPKYSARAELDPATVRMLAQDLA